MRIAACVAAAVVVAVTGTGSGCSSVSTSQDAGGGDGAIDGIPDDGGADSRFDAAPVWMEIASFPFTEMGSNPDAAAAGDLIFLARKDAPQWLKAFDTQSMLLADKTPNDSVCNCGYTGTLVASETGDALFYFANNGNRYDVAAGTWSSPAYPMMRGEAATGVHGGRVWQVGGRDTPYTSQTYDIGSMVWEPAIISDYPWALQYGGAVSLDRTLYVVGGDAGGSRRHLTSLAATVWATLPNAPFDIERPSLAAVQGRIAAVSSSSNAVAFYDPAGAGTWTVQPLLSGITGDKAIAAVDGTLYLFYPTGSTLRVARYIGPF
jgi:hypothetical protein